MNHGSAVCVRSGCVAAGDWMPLKSQGKTSSLLSWPCLCMGLWVEGGSSARTDQRTWTADPPSFSPIVSPLSRLFFNTKYQTRPCFHTLAHFCISFHQLLCPTLRCACRLRGLCQQVYREYSFLSLIRQIAGRTKANSGSWTIWISYCVCG